MKRVSFQGEHGAYSEGAAKSFFGPDISTVPSQTFSDALNSTIQDKTEFSVIPVENSIEGSVGESNDLLYSTELCAIGEAYYKIKHCLIGTGKLEQIKTVYSHPQALGQCRKFLQENSIKTVPTYDTAGSVKIIKEMNNPDAACIASKNASEIYSIPVIQDEIADNPSNYTRFLILSKNSEKIQGANKTSVIFSTKHEPGSLYRVIEHFAKAGINLTKIESRPKKSSVWEYNFYVDFEGSRDEPKISAMFEEIKRYTSFFKVLGSYPAAKIL